MRAKTLLIIFVTGVTLAALLFAFKDRSARHEMERATDGGRRQRAQLDGELRQAEQRLAGIESEQRRVEASLESARKKALTTPAGPARTSRPVVTTITPAAAAAANAVRNALINDPQFQNLRLAATQARLLGTYFPLCEQLHLTEAQREQFFGILRKREEQQMDFDAMMETHRPAADDPVFTKLGQQMTDDFRTAQTAVLGEAGFQQLETYERSVPARAFVDEFAGAATVAGAGITGDQADRLTRAMAEASATYRRGATVSVTTLDWDNVLTDAKTTLSESQLAVFKNAVIQFHNMDRLRELARRK